MYELPILPAPDEVDIKSSDENDVMENALFSDIPGNVPFICQPSVRIFLIIMTIIPSVDIILVALGIPDIVGRLFHFGMAFFVLFTEFYAMYFYVKEKQFKQFLYPVFLLIPEMYLFTHLAGSVFRGY